MFKSIAILFFLSFFIFAATCEKKEQISVSSNQENESSYVSEVSEDDSDREVPSAEDEDPYVDGEEEAYDNESDDASED